MIRDRFLLRVPSPWRVQKWHCFVDLERNMNVPAPNSEVSHGALFALIFPSKTVPFNCVLSQTTCLCKMQNMFIFKLFHANQKFGIRNAKLLTVMAMFHFTDFHRSDSYFSVLLSFQQTDTQHASPGQPLKVRSIGKHSILGDRLRDGLFSNIWLMTMYQIRWIRCIFCNFRKW